MTQPYLLNLEPLMRDVYQKPFPGVIPGGFKELQLKKHFTDMLIEQIIGEEHLKQN